MQPASVSLINVDMTPEQRFADLHLDGARQYCLTYNVKTLIPQEMQIVKIK